MTDQIQDKHSDLQALVRRTCTFWEQEHGKINDKNFIQCLAAVMESCGSSPGIIETAVDIIFEMGNIKHCSCCGRAPAYMMDVNGEPIELCSDCQTMVLFQPLGPREGYT